MLKSDKKVHLYSVIAILVVTADHLIHTKLGTGFPLDALLDASLPFLPALHPVAEVLELVGN